MARVIVFFYYLLAMFLAFGSVNPFRLGTVSSQITDQQGLSPLLFICCIVLSFLDKTTRRNMSRTGRIIVPMVILVGVIFISGFVYNEVSAFEHMPFFGKLFLCIVGFAIISSYFSSHPDTLSKSLFIYSITCVVLIAAFFGGFLESLSYYSNGRLWIFGINPNTFSFMMGLGALYLAFSVISHRQTVLIFAIKLVSILLIYLYVLLSGSRGTLLFLTLSMVILLFPYLRRKWWYVIPFVIIIAVSSARFLKTQSDNITIVERMSSLSQDRDREQLLINAYSLFEEHPLTGIGRNGYVEQREIRFGDSRDSHNILMSIMVMGGLISLSCFISYLLNIYRMVRRNGNSRLAICLLFYTITMALKTGDVITFLLMWYLFAVIISLKAIE